MAADFVEYGMNPEDIQQIFVNKPKVVAAPVVITTWQSSHNMPELWFQPFHLMIGDEAHRFKAASLKDLMSKTRHIPHKFGFTGSLDGSPVNQMVLEGLFGQHRQIVSTKQLMDEGYISPLRIKAIVLKYAPEEIKAVRKSKYPDEVDFLIGHEDRNKFIQNLALSLKGNTLVLYRYVEKHGIPLHKMIADKAEVPVYLVHGKVDSEERDEIRKIVNLEETSITVASMGCFSEGINIPNIHNIIFASPSKSRIQIMQSIGRGLRKSDGKDKCTLFDIADDLMSKSWKNHTIRHYADRVKLYLEEGFQFKQYKVRLKG